MSFGSRIIFALFRVVFVVTPGPIHLDRIRTDAAHRLRRGFGRASSGAIVYIWLCPAQATCFKVCGMLARRAASPAERV